ncbi:MAG: hypothetical protein AAF673_03445 [Pseudomonadota bacterium]
MKDQQKIKTIDFPTPAGTAKIKIDADSGEFLDANEQGEVNLYKIVELPKEEMIIFPTPAGTVEIPSTCVERLVAGAVNGEADA